MPFLFSENPDDQNFVMTDIFLMVNTNPCAKHLYFPDKYKPYDESSRKLLKYDLQRASQMNGNRLISNCYKCNDSKLMFVCFRHLICSKSSTNDSDDNVALPKPCFYENIQGTSYVRKKLAKKVLQEDTFSFHQKVA